MKHITIKDYPNYTVTEDGLVYSLKSSKYISMLPNKNVQYLQVSLWKNNRGKNFYVHRLVAEAFIPNPNNLPMVNHKDGNKLNNHVSNLEWVVSSENAQHAVDTGLKTYTNRLTQQEFVELLTDVINGESYESLSKRVPYKVPFLSTKLRSIAKDLGLIDALDASLKLQRAERNRKVLQKVNSSKVQRLSKTHHTNDGSE
jgi:hypothetical protein